MSAAAFETWDAPTSGVGMSEWQNGRCAWCGYGATALVRDHCHMTGLIRGLLCHACNQQESLSGSGEWDGWRAGDNVAATLSVFEIYRDHLGYTPIHPEGALSYYDAVERMAWYDQIVTDLSSGAAWPKDAPWTEAAQQRREDLRARAQVALDQGGRWSA